MAPKKLGNGIGRLKNLGIVGFTPWGYQEAVAKGAVTTRENPRLLGLLGQGLLGRVDGIYINIAVGLNSLKRMGRDGELVFDANLPHINGKYHLASLKHGKLMAKVDQILKKKQSHFAAMRKERGLEAAH